MNGPNSEEQYSLLLNEISRQILQSHYRAARLVNRELLLLYFAVGKRLSEKVAVEKWGTGVLEKLSTDLQKQLPRLRGFSYRNLRNMRQFAEAYSQLITDSSYSEATAGGNQSETIWQISSAKLSDQDFSAFLSLGFHTTFCC